MGRKPFLAGEMKCLHFPNALTLVHTACMITPLHNTLCTLLQSNYLCSAPNILLRDVHYKPFLHSDRSAVNPPEPLQPLETPPKPPLNHHYFS